jgi:hypothetical protein
LPNNLAIKDGTDFTDTVTLIDKIYNIKRVFDTVTARSESTLKFIENDYTKDEAKRALLTKIKLAVDGCRSRMREIWDCTRGRQKGFSWDIDVNGTMETIMIGTPTAWASITRITDTLPNRGRETYIKIFYTLDRLISEAHTMFSETIKLLIAFNIAVDSVGIPTEEARVRAKSTWEWLSRKEPITINAAKESLKTYSDSIRNLIYGAYNENILVPSFIESLIQAKINSYTLLRPLIALLNDMSNQQRRSLGLLMLGFATVLPPGNFRAVNNYEEQPYEKLAILEYVLSNTSMYLKETVRTRPEFPQIFNNIIDRHYPPQPPQAGATTPNDYFKKSVNTVPLIGLIRQTVGNLKPTMPIALPGKRTFKQLAKNRWWGGSKRRRVKRGRPSRRR